MARIVDFARSNRLAVGVVAACVTGALVAFPLLIGLNGGVGVVLVVLVAAASLVAYRLLSRVPASWDEPLAAGRLLFSGLVGLILVALESQVIPFGWDRSTPPVTGEP